MNTVKNEAQKNISLSISALFLVIVAILMVSFATASHRSVWLYSTAGVLFAEALIITALTGRLINE